MKKCLATLLALALLLPFPALAAEADAGADAPGTVSFENLAARVEAKSPLMSAYGELIAAADAVDREDAYDDLVEANNDLADVIWAFIQAGQTGAALVLQQQQEQIRDQLDAYKPENYAKTYADLVRPVEALKDQLIYGSQSLYISIAALEQDIEKGELRLAELDRTSKETQLLYSLGRVSNLSCEAAKTARDAAASQLDALTAKCGIMKTQLQNLIGETSAGELTLAPVPEVTEEELCSIQYDADLTAGLEASCEVYLAGSAVTDAKKAWEDADGYLKKSAEHSYNAAVYTLDAKKQAFRQSFDAVYRGVGTAQSAAVAAQEALTFQQKAYDAAALRFSLGLISQSALLSAGSALAEAKITAQSAKLGLASAFLSYSWARLGLLPAQV